MFRKIGKHIIKMEDVSYIGEMDKHINHASNSINHFFLVIVDGQGIEISALDKEKTEKLRDSVIEILKI